MLRPPVNGGNDLLREADDEKDDEEEEVPSVGQCSTREPWGRGPVLRLGLLLLFLVVVMVAQVVVSSGCQALSRVKGNSDEPSFWAKHFLSGLEQKLVVLL